MSVAEDYATVDVLSGGRVELIAGRGVYQQHYRQFGQTWEDSEELLAEAVDLLRRLWTSESVTWSGRLRPPLDAVTVHPRSAAAAAPSDLAVGQLVDVGGARRRPRVPDRDPDDLDRRVDAPPVLAAEYRQQWAAAGRPAEDARVGLHVHGYVGAGTSAEARAFWLPYQTGYLRWVLDDVKGLGTPMPPFMSTLGEPGSQAGCGSAADVATELAARLEAMEGVDLLLVQTDQGGLPPAEVRASLERFVGDVVPKLRRAAAAECPRRRRRSAGRLADGRFLGRRVRVERRGHQRPDAGDVGAGRRDHRRDEHEGAGLVDLHLAEQPHEVTELVARDVGPEGVGHRVGQARVVQAEPWARPRAPLRRAGQRWRPMRW